MVSDTTSHKTEIYKKLQEGLVIQDEVRPVIVYAQHTHDWKFRKWKFKGPFNEYNIKNFVVDATNGFAEEYHQSAKEKDSDHHDKFEITVQFLV